MAKKKVEKCKGCGRYVYINDDNDSIRLEVYTW